MPSRSRLVFRPSPIHLMRWLETMQSTLVDIGHLIPPVAVQSIAAELAIAAEVLDKHARRARRVLHFLGNGGSRADIVHLPDYIRAREPAETPADPAQLTLWPAPRRRNGRRDV